MTNNGGGEGGGGGGVLKKGPWSAGEDAVLIDYVKKHGEGNWNAVQRNTGLQRCGKSCRLRWANHLRPNLKKGAFSSDEERLIIDLHSKLGNKWARISAHLPGRTDNEIKNYWNTRVKRRLRQGLPLYPNEIQSSQQPPPPHPHPQTPHLHLHKTISNNPTTTLPLFDPVSLSSSLFTRDHPPPFLPSHPIKRLSPFLGRTVSAPSQLGIFQPDPIGFRFDPGQTQIEGGDPGLSLYHCRSSSFDGLCYELPSNQYCQKVTDDDLEYEEVKIDASNNVVRTNSGLLDDLLHEAQEKIGGGSLKRQKVECGFQWDISSSENSSTGIVKKEESEEQQMTPTNDDLLNTLELIPSLVRVPNWCSDGCQESSVGQSSVVSPDDNYNGLDHLLQLSPFSAASPINYDHVNEDDDNRNSSRYAWDNLPGIC